jgi:GDP-L-fucose synthase
MYKKLLVTGCSGVLGAALKRISHEYPGHEMVFSDSSHCDLTNLDNTLRYVKSIEPDVIMHLAAVSGGIELSIKQPATLLRDNVYMNMNILEAARFHNIKKTVMTLSSGMYPAEVTNPIREEYIHNGCPHESNYSYAFAKRLIEPSIRAYRAEYGINVVGLVPNGIFGENGDFSYTHSAMWAALIRRFYENRNNMEKIIIYGNGLSVREHSYSQDMARAFMWCLENYDEEQILNVGTTEEYSVKDIAYMIAEILQIDKNRIEFDVSKPSGIHRKSIDNSRFIKLSKFEFTPFRTALERTIRWFCENFDKPEQVLL